LLSTQKRRIGKVVEQARDVVEDSRMVGGQFLPKAHPAQCRPCDFVEHSRLLNTTSLERMFDKINNIEARSG